MNTALDQSVPPPIPPSEKEQERKELGVMHARIRKLERRMLVVESWFDILRRQRKKDIARD